MLLSKNSSGKRHSFFSGQGGVVEFQAISAVKRLSLQARKEAPIAS